MYSQKKSLDAKQNYMHHSKCKLACLIHAWHAKPKSVPRRDRVCRLCPLGAIEDEDHLLLVCPAHHDIRCKFGQQLGK